MVFLYLVLNNVDILQIGPKTCPMEISGAVPP